jgi:hypothetical protein
MLGRMKKRWLRPKMLGVLLAKLILSGATDLAAVTTPSQETQVTMQQSVNVNYLSHLPR